MHSRGLPAPTPSVPPSGPLQNTARGLFRRSAPSARRSLRRSRETVARRHRGPKLLGSGGRPQVHSGEVCLPRRKRGSRGLFASLAQESGVAARPPQLRSAPSPKHLQIRQPGPKLAPGHVHPADRAAPKVLSEEPSAVACCCPPMATPRCSLLEEAPPMPSDRQYPHGPNDSSPWPTSCCHRFLLPTYRSKPGEESESGRCATTQSSVQVMARSRKTGPSTSLDTTRQRAAVYLIAATAMRVKTPSKAPLAGWRPGEPRYLNRYQH
mmetsp:Transcript_30426/g.76941  ORF Transcript_30426/g.76941 Transcript_30426/m.76941 type:complete len:267 (-) Transcript_30426:1041-1841(-)